MRWGYVVVCSVAMLLDGCGESDGESNSPEPCVDPPSYAYQSTIHFVPPMAGDDVYVNAFYGLYEGVPGTPGAPMPDDLIECTWNGSAATCNDVGARLIITAGQVSGIWRGTNGPERGTYEAAPSKADLTLKSQGDITNAGNVTFAYSPAEEELCDGGTFDYEAAEASFDSD